MQFPQSVCQPRLMGIVHGTQRQTEGQGGKPQEAERRFHGDGVYLAEQGVKERRQPEVKPTGPGKTTREQGGAKLRADGEEYPLPAEMLSALHYRIILNGMGKERRKAPTSPAGQRWRPQRSRRDRPKP